MKRTHRTIYHSKSGYLEEMSERRLRIHPGSRSHRSCDTAIRKVGVVFTYVSDIVESKLDEAKTLGLIIQLMH